MHSTESWVESLTGTTLMATRFKRVSLDRCSLYFKLVYTTHGNTMFRATWLASLEVLSQVLFSHLRAAEEKQNGFSLYIVTDKVVPWATSYSACVVYTKTIIHLSVSESGDIYLHFNKETLTSPARLSFVLKVPLHYLCPSIIYPVQARSQDFFTGGCDQLIIRTNERRIFTRGIRGHAPREILKISCLRLHFVRFEGQYDSNIGR